MTVFRMLPVRRGDACFIHGRRGDFLFDGGLDGCGLVSMLNERRIRKLRVVACTNPCRERLGGILDLMEADFPVTEYWFPKDVRDLCEAAGRFNGDLNRWISLAKGESPRSRPEYDSDTTLSPSLSMDTPEAWLHSSAALMLLALALCEGTPRGWEDVSDRGLEQTFPILMERLSARSGKRWNGGQNGHALFRAMSKQFASGGSSANLARLCGHMLLAEADRLPGGEERGVKAIVTTLALTAMTAALFATTSAKLRFLSIDQTQQDHLISGHPVKCINGSESNATNAPHPAATADAIFCMTKRFAGHHRSHVYQYGNAKCSVLICGDSKFTFMGKDGVFELTTPTVVAAPRQGNLATEKAYRHISSKAPEKDLWVRSHYSYSRKVSINFKNRKGKICLGNCQDYTLQEIMLRCTGHDWELLAGRSCVCD